MKEADRDAGTARTLARIAQALGIPVARFYERDVGPAPLVCADPQEIALIHLFRTIPEEDRQRCLDLIRRIAPEP